jgi:hypothetical protein
MRADKWADRAGSALPADVSIPPHSEIPAKVVQDFSPFFILLRTEVHDYV